ncbi:MAG: hypothetical protein U1G05_13060 [Kiritimatiellia bacterium]
MIGIEAVNPIPSPAGLVGRLVVTLDQGPEISVPVDASWKCSDRSHEGWTAPNFDDSEWVAARELGAFGMAPWGRPAAPPVGLPMFRRDFQVANRCAARWFMCAGSATMTCSSTAGRSGTTSSTRRGRSSRRPCSTPAMISRRN